MCDGRQDVVMCGADPAAPSTLHLPSAVMRTVVGHDDRADPLPTFAGKGDNIPVVPMTERPTGRWLQELRVLALCQA